MSMTHFIKGLSMLILLAGLAFSQSYDIYCTDSETGETTRLTWLVETGEYNPNWSPCGNYIVHDVKGADVPLGHSVFITDVNSGESVQLIGAEGGNDAAWSPDGQEIAFDRDPPFGDPPDDPTVYIISASGGERRIVCTDAVNADWSPDGRRIVFSRPSDGSIYTVNTDGSDVRFVMYGYNPVWSPNGKKIAFEYEGYVWTVRVNKFGEAIKLPRRHTKGQFYYGSPSWAMDSKSLVFHSDRDGEFDIWTVRVPWGKPGLLAGLDDYGEYDPSFSKMDKRVAYSGFTIPAGLARQTVNETPVLKADGFALAQNYPNPFNPKTVISYQLPTETQHVELSIYNIVGQKVATLVSGMQAAGTYKVEWDASGIVGGVYLYHLQTGEFTESRKMILVR